MSKRMEKDTMGEIAVPGDKLYGAETARAIENFPISGQGVGAEMIRALGLVKKAAAIVNKNLGKLDSKIADAIAKAADEVAEGALDDHFPVDVFQTGSGTSSNMNANEVIANRACQLLGSAAGDKRLVHPNDHVNMGQSSNDVFPTALHVAALVGIQNALVPALSDLRDALEKKSEELGDIIKIGRTHLQDAVPMTMGQEFSGFASQIEHGLRHLKAAAEDLKELPIGGTAVGTGLNTHPEFGALMAGQLVEMTGETFVEAPNHFEAQSARDAAVRVSGALKAVALSVMKIADDIRWLGSGPRLGLGELKIPAVQPGSSIMAGKVNPVIAESVIQAAAQVIGNDAAIAAGGMLGNFQLNTAQPLIARNLLEQIRLLANSATAFTQKLLLGIEPNTEHIKEGVDRSLAMVTALVPFIGYEKAAALAKEAEAEGKTIRKTALEKGVLAQEQLDEALDPKKLIKTTKKR
jgi:fumarate hydratase class II